VVAILAINVTAYALMNRFMRAIDDRGASTTRRRTKREDRDPALTIAYGGTAIVRNVDSRS